MKAEDCFAMMKNPESYGKCTAVSRMDCTGCPFYKSHRKYDEDLRNAADKLSKKGLKPIVREEVRIKKGKRTYVPIMSTERIFEDD